MPLSLGLGMTLHAPLLIVPLLQRFSLSCSWLLGVSAYCVQLVQTLRYSVIS